MGWFKKAIDKIVDPFVPESVKKTADKLVPEDIKHNATWSYVTAPFGGAGIALAEASSYQNTSGSAGAAAKKLDIGNLTDEEAQAAAQKRLARIGRYFTSVLGDLSGASTGKQKVFS